MPRTFTVQMDEEAYRIVGPDGEEGDAVPYGEPAVLVIGEAFYYSLIEDPDDSEVTVLKVDSVSQMPTETEEVEFEDAEEAEITDTGGPVLVETKPEDQ